MSVDRRLVRQAWQVAEPVAVLPWFAPETRAATDRLGLRGGLMSYLGTRLAPMGAVSASAATAVLFSMAPAFVARAVPDVWSRAAPSDLVEARYGAVDEALRRILGGVGGPRVASAASAAARLVESLGDGLATAGRPLAAANASAARRPERHLQLWQDVTVLREHRGDGHVVALGAWGVGPCEAHVLAAADGRVPASVSQRLHGWDLATWEDASDALRCRGWVSTDGRLTAAGVAARDGIERDTDRLAEAPYRAAGLDATRGLVDLLRPLAERLVDAGAVPAATAAGVPWPPEPTPPPEPAQRPAPIDPVWVGV